MFNHKATQNINKFEITYPAPYNESAIATINITITEFIEVMKYKLDYINDWNNFYD